MLVTMNSAKGEALSTHTVIYEIIILLCFCNFAPTHLLQSDQFAGIIQDFA